MTGHLKALRFWLGALALVWLIQLIPTGNGPLIDLMDPYFLRILIYCGFNITLAVSLNLINGFTGQFSIGHAGFMSVGGYSSAYFSLKMAESHGAFVNSPLGGTITLVLALIIGAVSAGAVGFLVGQPSLRLKGDYLAIVTLGFGEIIRVLVLNIDAIGGARGLPNIPLLTNFGWTFTVVLLTVFSVWRIVNSAHGRSLLSVREDEIAAEAMGVNTTRAKVSAFVIGAAFAGVAGCLFGHYLQYLNPQTFDFNRSFEIIIMVVLGGMGSVSGSILAAIFLTVLREALRPLQELTHVDYRMVIYSLCLIVLMLTRPNGMLGTREITDFLPKRIRRMLGFEEAQA